ncbi:hypothetical protein CI109_105432 [Kwoniella shandongensis]|uniref:Uncharacterized protein n=1 Tax=Kwoniella shandongensis TaxID=1734106 RepID=A0A5M6C2M9_9TREE|nr:uncharacterized protein CI109_002153 [Kwoniella shandongensis]KAA5529263.1 hypothetical protein CI109_002153 [Kwoniella shandongensis]
MPYVPPGQSSAGPLPVIPRSAKTITKPSGPSIPTEQTKVVQEDVPTPRAETVTSHPSSAVPTPPPSQRTDSTQRHGGEGESIDDLTSQLDSTSLRSNDNDNVPPPSTTRTSSSPPPSLSSSSIHQPSPASTSILSLSEQGTDSSAPSSTRGDDEDECAGEEGGVGGGGGGKVVSTPASTTTSSPGLGESAMSRYREQLYAYTHSLYIQAKLSSSKAERRRQSVSFGVKPSGMEKMAAKKALARHLNS